MPDTVSVGTLIWFILGDLGVLAAAIGLMFRRLEKHLDKREKALEEKEDARLEHDTLTLEMTFASLTLAEATAEAVQRIPDAHCNGDMHDALAKAKAAKDKYRSFEMRQTARSLH